MRLGSPTHQTPPTGCPVGDIVMVSGGEGTTGNDITILITDAGQQAFNVLRPADNHLEGTRQNR